jgi:hydroxymethylpyrimidine pyrophosphatase-like HAD family hydrolase
MDETLLDDSHRISEENKSALKESQNKGVIIAVTTGRLFASASHYYSLLGIESPIIASNGTYIRETSSSEFIFKDVFTFEESKDLYEILCKTGLTPYFYTYNIAITPKAFPRNHTYMIFNKEVPEKSRIKFRVSEDLLPVLKEY